MMKMDIWYFPFLCFFFDPKCPIFCLKKKINYHYLQSLVFGNPKRNFLYIIQENKGLIIYVSTSEFMEMLFIFRG